MKTLYVAVLIMYDDRVYTTEFLLTDTRLDDYCKEQLLKDFLRRFPDVRETDIKMYTFHEVPKKILEKLK